MLILTLTSNKNLKIKNAGFTLLEVIISITILSFIMISVITIQNQSQESTDRIIAEDKNWLQVETAFSRLEWDFSHIYSPLYYSHEMKNDQLLTEDEQEAFNIMTLPYSENENFAFLSYDAHPVPIIKHEQKSSFEFFTTSNRRKFKNIKQSNYAWVRYDIQDLESEDSDQPQKVLVRYFYPDNPFIAETIPWDNVKGQILLRNITSLKFEFWDRLQRKWFDDLTLVQNGQYKLSAVKVIIDWLDLYGQKYKFERIFRPLFPHFEPEDMYKLERRTQAPLPKGSN